MQSAGHLFPNAPLSELPNRMSIFTKPLSKLDSSDLHELLQDQAIENLRLEFKLEAPGKDETLKKISSPANTFDGFVVGRCGGSKC